MTGLPVLPILVLWPLACGGVDTSHRGHEAEAVAPALDAHAGHGTPSAAPDGPIVVSGDAARAIGLRTVAARAGEAAPDLRAPAVASFDPTRTRRVTVNAGGRVQVDRVPRVGESVSAGQVLAHIWHPELRVAFEELLWARPLGEPWASAARGRLLVLGVPASEIDAAGSSTPETWGLRAPISGLVVAHPVPQGGWLPPGGLVAEIADPEARVVELVTTDPPALGTAVHLTDGVDTWQATVVAWLPTGGAAGRGVRLLPQGDIVVGRPLTASWSGTATSGLWVPRSAVVDTGQRRTVFVAGPEGYQPRAVTVGVRTPLEVQILSGLDAGEEVVVAGTFLFDSETQMRGTRGHAGHGG